MLQLNTILMQRHVHVRINSDVQTVRSVRFTNSCCGWLILLCAGGHLVFQSLYFAEDEEKSMVLWADSYRDAVQDFSLIHRAC